MLPRGENNGPQIIISTEVIFCINPLVVNPRKEVCRNVAIVRSCKAFVLMASGTCTELAACTYDTDLGFLRVEELDLPKSESMVVRHVWVISSHSDVAGGARFTCWSRDWQQRWCWYGDTSGTNSSVVILESMSSQQGL